MNVRRGVSRVTERPNRFGLDRFTLYELCAQNPARDARLLHAIYADQPGRVKAAPTLCEDFCGTAALAAAWCRLLPHGRAIGIDIDGPTLERAHGHPRLRLVRSDVRRSRARADLIAVLNFSICELHTRNELIGYLRSARRRLHPRGRCVCDIYGGSDAFITGSVPQNVRGPRAERIRYIWEQRSADPLTGRVIDAMHFYVRARTGRNALALRDAFVYDWRLWSVPELRDAMAEAGFARSWVYQRTPGAIDQAERPCVAPVRDALEVGDAFNVLVVADR